MEEMTIFDMLSKQLLNLKVRTYEEQVSIKNFNSGIYFLKIKSANKFVTKTFIKQ